MRSRRCQEHRIYQGGPNQAACGEHQDDRAKESQNNDDAYPDAYNPCYLCSLHGPVPPCGYISQWRVSMSIMMNIADLLLRPADFFSAHLKGDKPDMKMPLAIVLLSGIVGAVSAAYVSSVTMAMMPSEVAEMGTMLIGIGAVAAFIGALFFWVIIAAVFHGISALRGGKGDFQRTLAVAGYGSLPMVFGSIISSIVIYFSLSGANIRPVSDPMQINAAITALMSGPSMMMAVVISLLFVLWSANIWVFGMQEARDISGRDALITVGIPVLIYMLITVLPYIG